MITISKNARKSAQALLLGMVALTGVMAHAMNKDQKKILHISKETNISCAKYETDKQYRTDIKAAPRYGHLQKAVCRNFIHVVDAIKDAHAAKKNAADYSIALAEAEAEVEKLATHNSQFNPSTTDRSYYEKRYIPEFPMVDGLFVDIVTYRAVKMARNLAIEDKLMNEFESRKKLRALEHEARANGFESLVKQETSNNGYTRYDLLEAAIGSEYATKEWIEGQNRNENEQKQFTECMSKLIEPTGLSLIDSTIWKITQCDKNPNSERHQLAKVIGLLSALK